MVEAADRLAALARAAEQARAAVAADVAERADLAVVVADDEDGLVDDVGRHVAARARQVRDVARELPRALEDGSCSRRTISGSR